MCGIIGYTGDRDALPIVATGLKNLEYRGYDSAGVALLEDGDRLTVYKQEGEIDDLDLPDRSSATTALGHTRWSTHGKPTDANAHPHVDCAGEIAVVHNGIIENYDVLRTELEGRGHTFASDTDTEVVPHLVEELLAEHDGDLFATVEAVVGRLEGSYAIGVVSAGTDGIVAARQDSPLVIGHGEGERFIASDVTAFLEHTKEVSHVENGDVVRATPEGVTIRNGGAVVERDTRTVDWEAEAAEKGGYEHYMLKEIHEQPRALRQAISGRIDELNHRADLELGFPDEYLQSIEEIQLVAAGTSYHAGLYAGKLLEAHADVRTSVTIASEYEFTGGRDPWRTLVIAVSQSGETADTLRALRRASGAGARTLAITNTLGSTVTREADDTVYIRAGPEIGVAATKTFVSQVATLGLVTVYLGRARNALGSGRAGELLDAIQRLPGAVQRTLDYEDEIREVAAEYADGEAFFFIGRRLGHPVALEGALKLKEISYDHAEGFPAGELKHGPLALVTAETPVLAVLTEGSAPEKTLNNVKEVQSRDAPVIGLTSRPDAGKFLDVALEIPDLGALAPLVANVPLQLFAYHVARRKDRAIDKPRNLAKSVTVD